MTWNTSLRRAAGTVLAVTAIVAFVLTTQSPVLSQGRFAAGQKVMASPEMIKDEKYYKPCTVVKFDSTANAYLLNCDGAEYLVQSAYIRAGKAEAAPVNKPEADVAPPKEEDLPVTKPDKPATTNKGGGKFKIGDRVLASPLMLKDDKYYQPCTVIGINPPNSYALRCDPHGGISFQNYSVREDFVKAGNVGPAPTFECSFEHPPEVNRKTAPSSPPVFKHVIYELEKLKFRETRVGVKFQSFEIGKPFRNIYRNAKSGLLYSGFPEGATIFPIKTRFVRCVERRADNLWTVLEGHYACGKDRFGQWSCGTHEHGGLTELQVHYLSKE